MKGKKRMELAEMAANATPRVNGRLVCPRCGCSHFLPGKMQHVGTSISRYRKCAHCGVSALTWQSEERIIRIVNDGDHNKDDSIDDTDDSELS